MSVMGYYTGQTRKARELAVKELGTEKAALMSDHDVTEWIEDNFKIFWGDIEDDYGKHSFDEELIVLMPNDVYESVKDSIVWLHR